MTSTAHGRTSVDSPGTRSVLVGVAREPSSARRFRGPGNAAVVVFVVAILARLAVVVRHGGLDGLYGYDAGVYFGGADSFIHGRLPYLDYIQVHPPAITVTLAPFAALTEVMSDSAAFTVTILAFTVLGAINAVLVTRVARHLRLGRAAEWGAGLFYALWMGSVGAEYLIKLEPLANLFVLVSLLLALRAERRRAVWSRSLVAGIPLGLAVSTKIWLIVPVLAIMVWHAWRLHAPRRGLIMLGGAAAAAVVLNGPFFLAAPRRMWSSVITDQLSRPHGGSPMHRMKVLSSVAFLKHLPSTPADVLFGIFAVLALGVLVSAWQVRVARPFVVLVAIQFVVVQAAPSFFWYYSDYLAIAAALVVGAAVAQRSSGRRAGRLPGVALLAAVGAVSGVVLTTGTIAVAAFPAAASLARSVRDTRCVMSDSPAAQLRLDALSRGLANGCPNWIDVTGPTYGRDRAAGPRATNVKWQRDFLHYLQRGDAVVLVRGKASGASHALLARVRAGGVQATSHHTTVWRVRHGRRSAEHTQQKQSGD